MKYIFSVYMRVLKFVSSYKMYIMLYSVAEICESFSLPGQRAHIIVLGRGKHF